jgi:hypothetical protein
MVNVLSRAFSARTLLILVARAAPLGYPECRLRRQKSSAFSPSKSDKPQTGRTFFQRLAQPRQQPDAGLLSRAPARPAPLLNRVAAIDHEVGAIHHVAGIGRKKEGCCRDLLRISETAGRQFALKFFADFTRPRFFSKLG